MYIDRVTPEPHGLSLHSRPLLPAPPREPVAGGHRTPGLRAPVSRLERTHHRGVLRHQHRRAHPGQHRPHPPDRKQLPQDELRFRPHAALLAGVARPEGLPGHPRRRQNKPGAVVGTARLGHGASLQPHDHAAGEPPRQDHPGRLGHPRFRAPLRALSRRHVAPRNRGRHRDPRDSRRTQDPLHRSCRAPGPPRIENRRARLEGRLRRAYRPLDGLSVPPPFRPGDQPVLLRRPHFPGHRLRESAGQRRSSSWSGSCPVSPRTCGPGPNWSTSPPTARPSATITRWAK